MAVTVVIPTCRDEMSIAPLLCDLEGFCFGKYKVHATCGKVSASVNRNSGLNMVALGEIVVMIDDDIHGFTESTIDDLVYPLLHDGDVVMSSARLLNPDGTLGTMSGENYDVSESVVEVKAKQLPTACVAFRNDGTRFDERFLGSGYEDTWFCNCLAKKYPRGKFIIVNKCRLVHLNEQKGASESLAHNQRVYEDLCGGRIR